MKYRCVILIFLLGATIPCSSQTQDNNLTRKVRELLSGFHGKTGVFVKNLKTGATVEINADSLFPTASMIKIPIAIGVFAKINAGVLRYDSVLTYADSLLYEGVDILGSFKNGESIQLDKVILLMLTMSDNTASLWCQSLAGSGTMINHWLNENGFRNTRVNSRTPGRELARERYGWGQTSPREMAELMLHIRNGEVISRAISERLYRDLTRNYWDTQGLSQIPPYIHVASKNGSVDASKSEVVLVHAPHGDYVYCVATKNQTDQRWVEDNEGFVLLRKLSALLWEYFEPQDRWSPADD